MLIRLIAVEHIGINAVRNQRLTGRLDDLFHHILRGRPILREDIEGLHIHLGEQAHSSPIGSAVLARGINVGAVGAEQRARLFEVGDHKLPALFDALARTLDSFRVAVDRIDDRQTQSVRVHLKEDLTMPVCQCAVKEALTAHIVELRHLCRSCVGTEFLDALQGLGGQIRPFTDIGIGSGQITRLRRRVIILTECPLVVRSVQIRGVIIKPNTHREPIESIQAKGMILRISGCHQLINLIHRRREIGLRQSLRIGNIKEVLARRQCQRKYKYIRYFFHNPVFLSISLKHHIQSEREQTVRQITILRIDIP